MNLPEIPDEEKIPAATQAEIDDLIDWLNFYGDIQLYTFAGEHCGMEPQMRAVASLARHIGDQDDTIAALNEEIEEAKKLENQMRECMREYGHPWGM